MLREKAMQYQADMRTTPTYLNEDPRSLKLFAKITFYITCLQLQKKNCFQIDPAILDATNRSGDIFSIKAILSFPKATTLRVANDKTPTWKSITQLMHNLYTKD